MDFFQKKKKASPITRAPSSRRTVRAAGVIEAGCEVCTLYGLQYSEA